MREKIETLDQLEAIAFVGDALAPFFLQDPKTGNAHESFAAFAALDVDSAAGEWPFGGEEHVRRGLADMTDGLRNGEDDDLTWEYRRLFVGPGHKAAPPWGSVYMDRDGVMFGVSALDLRDWMRSVGIARLADDGEPDDHIGLLLMMMAWIARHRPELLDEFLGAHVLTWSAHYMELLQNVAEHPFYRGLSIVTRESLEGIKAVREIEVDYPRFYR